MNLALTYNLKRSSREEEAEFDSAETIAALADILRALGHEVVPVDVSCSVVETVRRLRRAAPDLVFNLAEGRRGAFREGFFPALFDELGLRYTGSGPSVLALCLDKALANRVVRAAGVRVPEGWFVRDATQLPAVSFPAIVKPNFEGSSKGITQASVVTDACGLHAAVADALARYPEGVLVEELVDGMDVSVAWVDGLGVLAPIGYVYEPTGRHAILDLALKQGPAEGVQVAIPPALDASVREELVVVASRAFAALGVSGYGRADFRVSARGEVCFLEMNPLPSLAPDDEELYAAAAFMGKSPADLLGSIVAAVRTAA
jgi:D-alanine-D-alanine ligase